MEVPGLSFGQLAMLFFLSLGTVLLECFDPVILHDVGVFLVTR